MKTKNFLIIALLLSGCISQKLFAQTQLAVTMIDSFPVLPDTAVENQLENFNITVYNMDSNAFTANDSLRIFLRNTDTTNLTQPEQVLGSVFIGTLSGNDTITFFIQGYNFTPATYRAGNNIVVVWPKIGNITGTTYDSLQLDTIYFVPLLSVNMLSEQNQSFSLFPNPVTDEIRINSDHQNPIEYVRILNNLGQVIMFRRSAGEPLDVRHFSEGFYFLEVKDQNGTIFRKKFLKL
jgi:type IX secretion system substrate protein